MKRNYIKKQRGHALTPTEYRLIQNRLDQEQRERTYKGIIKSKQRIAATGQSQSEYRRKRKPKNHKPRIYDIERFTRTDEYA